MNSWGKSDISGKYLVVEQEWDNEFEDSMIRTLRAEQILIPCISYEKDRRCACYTVTGLLPAGTWLSRQKLSAEQLKDVILQWHEALDTMVRHLLGEGNILWSMDHLFVEEKSGKWYFCARSMPTDPLPAEHPWKMLTEELLKAVDLENPEAVRMGMQLLKSVMEGGELHDLVRVLQERTLPEDAVQDSIPNNMSGANSEGELFSEIRIPGPEDPAEETEEEMPAGRRRDRRLRREKVRKRPEGRDYSAGRLVRRLLVSQLVMAVGLGSVFLMKGFDVVLKVLPLYAVLCVLVAVYLVIDDLSSGSLNRV